MIFKCLVSAHTHTPSFPTQTIYFTKYYRLDDDSCKKRRFLHQSVHWKIYLSFSFYLFIIFKLNMIPICLPLSNGGQIITEDILDLFNILSSLKWSEFKHQLNPRNIYKGNTKGPSRSLHTVRICILSVFIFLQRFVPFFFLLILILFVVVSDLLS